MHAISLGWRFPVMPDASVDVAPASRAEQSRRAAWVFPLLRVVFVVAVGFLAWYVAGHWNRWTGAARYESTDDAYMTGDITPLAAKVSGYVASVPVGDYQAVHKGD